MLNSSRVIHLGLYSETAKFIISKLYSLMKSSYNYTETRAVRTSNIEIAPDNEVIIRTDVSDYYYRKTKWCLVDSDRDLKGWLASLLKRYVYEYVNKCEGLTVEDTWKNNSDKIVEVFSTHETRISYAMLHFVYDTLHMHKNFEKKYSADVITLIKGVQADPVAAEFETARREEIARLKQEFADYETKLRRDKWAERGAAVKKIEDEIDKKYQVLLDTARKEMLDNIEKTNMTGDDLDKEKEVFAALGISI